jgi:hypothetical protein
LKKVLKIGGAHRLSEQLDESNRLQVHDIKKAKILSGLGKWMRLIVTALRSI